MGKRIVVSFFILFITLHNIFTEAAPRDKEKLLNFTNLRVCQAERFSTEKMGSLAVELCNGNRDCPNGEDEEPNMCMFHSLNQGSLRQLQRDFLRFSGATPSSSTPYEFVKIKS
ncbi:unnamed protein product, partial [Mesorhabditis belari]|uniref:Uncharacterized protein n=1 Tax=Mesorhabditis belari TaxID=2138241 RepID=A0AAF3F8D7_9BILA